MAKNGFIIRLIDIAMIILFGFIAISDIKVRAQIKLPANEEEPQAETEKEPVLIFVEIGLENQISIRRGEDMIAQTAGATDLENILVQMFEDYQTRNEQMVVLIEPDENSPIQHTIDILDICERHQIPKNINYESMQF